MPRLLLINLVEIISQQPEPEADSRPPIAIYRVYSSNKDRHGRLQNARGIDRSFGERVTRSYLELDREDC
jgi:hypothetical protein